MSSRELLEAFERIHGREPLPAWRGVLQCWAGPMITLGVLLFFIFGIGRHWHG